MGVLETAQKFIWEHPVEFAYGLFSRNPAQYQIVLLVDQTLDTIPIHIAVRDKRSGYIYDATGAYSGADSFEVAHTRQTTRRYAVAPLRDAPQVLFDSTLFYDRFPVSALGVYGYEPEEFNQSVVQSEEMKEHIERVLCSGPIHPTQDIRMLRMTPKWRTLEPGSAHVLSEFKRICEIEGEEERAREVAAFQSSGWWLCGSLPADEYDRVPYMLACVYDRPDMLRISLGDNDGVFRYTDDDDLGLVGYAAVISNPQCAIALMEAVRESGDFDEVSRLELFPSFAHLLKSPDPDCAKVVVDYAEELIDDGLIPDVEIGRSGALHAVPELIVSRLGLAGLMEFFVENFNATHDEPTQPNGVASILVRNLRNLADLSSANDSERRAVETAVFALMCGPDIPFASVQNAIGDILHPEHLSSRVVFNQSTQDWLTPLQYVAIFGGAEHVQYLHERARVPYADFWVEQSGGSPLELACAAGNSGVFEFLRSASAKDALLEAFSDASPANLPPSFPKRVSGLSI